MQASHNLAACRQAPFLTCSPGQRSVPGAFWVLALGLIRVSDTHRQAPKQPDLDQAVQQLTWLEVVRSRCLDQVCTSSLASGGASWAGEKMDLPLCRLRAL